MVIMAAKVPKRKILIILLLLLAAVLVLSLCFKSAGGSAADSTTESAPPAKMETNEDRIAFLRGYGWEVTQQPVQTQQVRVPKEPGEVFLRYNDLQISQGYDLMQYAGKELTRYVYEITNYPDTANKYYATLLVLDGEVVGADIASGAQNGIMHGLKKPS